MPRPLAAIALLGVVAAGCGGPGTGDAFGVLGTSGWPHKPLPGTAVLEATVRTAGPRTVDRVALEVRPSGARADLAYDAARGAFAGTVVTEAGQQTIAITASAGSARAGSVKVGAALVPGTAARLDALVLDTSAGWPLPDGSPAVTALVLSPTTLAVGATLSASAQAADPSGVEPALLWSSDCAGSFAPATGRNTSWSPAAPGTCAVTVRASSASGTVARSGTVEVTPSPGQLDVAAIFVPAPLVEEVTISAAAGACSVTRSGADASCRTRVAPGETATVAASLATVTGATLEWSDDCGGAFAPRELTRLPAVAISDWTAPAGGPVVCTLVPTLSVFGMVDAFPVAVLVADASP